MNVHVSNSVEHTIVVSVADLFVRPISKIEIWHSLWRPPFGNALGFSWACMQHSKRNLDSFSCFEFGRTNVCGCMRRPFFQPVRTLRFRSHYGGLLSETLWARTWAYMQHSKKPLMHFHVSNSVEQTFVVIATYELFARFWKLRFRGHSVGLHLETIWALLGVHAAIKKDL